MKEGRTLNISVSSLTLIKIVTVLAGIYLLYLIADIVALMFAAIILTSAIEPLVRGLEKIKINKAIAIVLIYLAMLLLVGLSVYLIIPPIISESKELGANLPKYINKTSNFFFNLKDYTQKHNWPFDLQDAISNLTLGLQSGTQSLINTVSSIFGGIFSFFLVLVITFYMTMEKDSLKKSVKIFLPKSNQNRVFGIIDNVQQKIGWWFRGQMALCFIIFLMTYVSLSIFGLKYALVLAIIAGLAEIIPYLGPTISAVPAVFIAFVQSPLLALFILFVYIIIQLVENNILVPKIMQKAVGLDPIVSIAVLMIGFKLGSVMGAILAIPLTTALSVVVKDWLTFRNNPKIKKITPLL